MMVVLVASMAEPIVQPVDSTVHVNEQLDSTITPPKERDKLKANFKSFFDELDNPPPAVPPPDAKVEPVKEEPLDEQSKEEQPVETQPPEEQPKEEVDPVEPKIEKTETLPEVSPTLESLEPHPDASPQTKSQFAQLKEITKRFRDTANLYKEKLGPVLKDLGFELSDSPESLASTLEAAGNQIKSFKNGAMSPEVAKELEDSRGALRAIGVLRSEDFIRDYEKPLKAKYIDALDDMAKLLPFDKEEEKANFLETMKTKWKPENVPAEWWEKQIDFIPKEKKVDTARIIGKAGKVTELAEAYVHRLNEISTNENSYENWKKQEEEKFSKNYYAEVRDEVEKLKANEKPIISEWWPQSTNGVNDPKKLEEIKKHNAHFQQLEQKFSNTIVDFLSGPRKAAKIALDLIEMQETQGDLKKSGEIKDAEIKALKAEVEKLKNEVTTKRRISDSPLKPAAGSGAKTEPEKSKLPKSQKGDLEEVFKKWNP